MASQIRFDTPVDLANKMIAKLGKQELVETTRELVLHINAQIPVKQLEKAVAATVEAAKPTLVVTPDKMKMWLYQARKGWAIANINTQIDKVADRLQKHYGCKILATKDGKINFLPPKPTTIDALLKKGTVIYRPDLNKNVA
jgi:hypothetical protein